ncbi:MAG: hypothetical protein CVV27_11760 [Candidatus Melainabacteria bacterium HGW-Melainabacteria-1]|nr:MAG: hypothetical protein CVV27_11760 [Candidatus Melainabacteria bacterium HGW-Melainabacteria-1]
MSNSLNFSAGAAASLRQAQATGGVKAVAAPTTPKPTEAAPAPAARQAQRPVPVAAPVHMNGEEMERHVHEALERSPVLNEEQAPLIDLAHLDAPAEDEAEIPEAEADDFDVVEFAGPEPEPAAEAADEDGSRAATGGGGDYLAEELKLYQRDSSQPARRQAHLLPDHSGAEKPRSAAVAVGCESTVGGLARSLQGMRGDFVGLAGHWRGKAFGVRGAGQPAQVQPLLKQLRAELPNIDYILLDLEKLPPVYQGQVIKTLATLGAKPQQIMVWQGQGNCHWA